MGIKKLLNRIGPGIITAALVFGPGSLTVNTKLGAGYGYLLLWVVPVAMIFMMAYTRIATGLGISQGETLMQRIRVRYGSFWAVVIGLGIFAITASFQAGNAIGAGIAFAELSHTDFKPWVVGFSLAAISLLFFKSFYRILEKIMIGLVVLMLFSFILTLVFTGPNLLDMLLGLIPTVPSGSELLVIALVASSFSIVGAFYQAYLVQEKGWHIEDTRNAMAESRNGIIILGLLSMLVMMCAAAVLFDREIQVNTASDLGLALEPLLGTATSWVFMIGFFAASFSSLIGNATIGGTILADTFQFGRNLSSWPVRVMIILVISMGSLIAILFGRLPLELIVFAQAITIIIAPAAAWFLLRLDYEYQNLSLQKYVTHRLIAILGLVVLILLAIYNINRLFL